MDHAFDTLQRSLAGRFSIERTLGRGGMGLVYLARDILLERQLAIKVLPPDIASAAGRERLLREARTAARLQHPNIVSIYSVETLGDTILICMEYINGGTLAERIRERGHLPQADAIRVLREVSAALAYAHRQGVIHRDIKPENILLDRDSGRAMIADFGIAQLTDAGTLTASGELVGTAIYMSPEQANGERADGRSDLYALGIVAHACLAGRPPFEGDARSVLAQHLTQRPPSLMSLRAGLSPRLVQVVDRCLAKEPSERFQTGEDLAEALESVADKPREPPNVLARWLGAPHELTLSEAMMAPLFALGVWSALDFFLNPWFGRIGPKVFDVDVGMVVGFILPPFLYLARRAHLLRQVLADGYGADDLRASLRAAGPGDAASQRVVTLGSSFRRLFLGSVIGLVAMLMPAIPGPAHTWDDVMFFAFLWLTSVGGVVDGTFGLVTRGESLAHRLRRKFWDAPWRSWITGTVGMGLRGRRRAPELGNRETEFGLAAAALVLFEALPNQIRQRLATLPSTLRLLEAAAHRNRERIAMLDRLSVDAPLAVGYPPDDRVEQHRALAAQERLAARDRAEQHLREVIAALEMFRLDLLRLHAHDANQDSVTANIEAALAMSRALERESEAFGDVRLLLARARTYGRPDVITP